jgi:DNA polymerase I-like protein with 3'-5' exonuclease and polymerase domains
MNFPDLHQFPHFAIDTETTGVVFPKHKAFGISISTPDGKDYYWDIRETPSVIQWLHGAVNSYRGIIIAHNASFDYKMLLNVGIKVPLKLLDDTCIRACMINEHLFSFALDDLAKRYLGEEKDNSLYPKMAEIFGGLATRNVQMARISQAPVEIVAPYAMKDTNLTLKLWEWQEKEIDRQQLHKICSFERSLMPMIIDTEVRGVRVDLEYAEKAMHELTPHIDSSQAKVNRLNGKEINTNSAKQVREYFSPKQKDGNWFIGDNMIESTPSGNPSIDSPTLRRLNDPMAREILNLRSLIKTRDTFMKGHVIGHSFGGRVYPCIRQNKSEQGGTSTGRLSYQSPALQQIPSRNKEIAKIVKQAFLPEEGHVWVDADMASFEVRVFAHLVNNAKIVQAYVDDPMMDLHQYVADLTGLPRSATYAGQPYAKALNLACIFNSGNGAIADSMGMPWAWESFETRTGELVTYKKAGEAAMRVIETYHQKVGGVRELANGCKAVAESRGYIFTGRGRHLRFPRGHKSYKASGILIQSTSADINKENWLTINETLGSRGRLILNTHDSYSMSMPEDSWQSMYADVKRAIEVPKLRVPLVLDLNGVGKTWWGALTGEINGK